MESTLGKMLILINLLKNNRLSLDELALQLSKSERQIRRDLDTLERFFELDYDFDNRPFICVWS